MLDVCAAAERLGPREAVGLTDLEYDIWVWKRQWEDICTAAGMSGQEAKTWVRNHWQTMCFRYECTELQKYDWIID
jgi:hypothetical protein